MDKPFITQKKEYPNRMNNTPTLKKVLSFYHRYHVFFVFYSLCFGINYFITWVLTDYFGIYYILSYGAGTFINWTFNFFSNSKVTFRGHDTTRQLQRYVRFLILYTCLAPLNFGTVYLLTSIFHVHYLISVPVATITYSVINYTILKKKIYTFSKVIDSNNPISGPNANKLDRLQ